MKKYALVALAGIATLGSANAATYAVGDLIMGFRSPTTTPANVVEVNLGSSTAFAANNTAVNLPVININAVLTAAFGAGWATDADLRAGIHGIPSLTTIFASRVQNPVNPGVDSSTNPGTISNTNFNTAAGNIGAYVGQFDNLTTPAVTEFNGGLSILAASSLGQTYEEYITASTTFGIAGIHPGEDTFNGGASTFALDIYQIVNTGTSRVSTWEGTFTMNNAGDVFFSSTQAVPEPGRAALVLLGAVGALFRRRRNA